MMTILQMKAILDLISGISKQKVSNALHIHHAKMGTYELSSSGPLLTC